MEAALASASYGATRARVEDYFDRTATDAWARLTSDAPVSGIRATVRAGRNAMRAALLGALPLDLRGVRVLDAGCGTGALAVELAARGGEVVAVDLSPALVAIARERCPLALRDRIAFHAGDLLDPTLGRFDHAVAMDSLIYYDAADIARVLGGLAPRLGASMLLTVAPRTPLLMAMWRIGKLLPRADRSPAMVPQDPARLALALQVSGAPGRLMTLTRVHSGFYHSVALEYRP